MRHLQAAAVVSSDAVFSLVLKHHATPLSPTIFLTTLVHHHSHDVISVSGESRGDYQSTQWHCWIPRLIAGVTTPTACHDHALQMHQQLTGVKPTINRPLFGKADALVGSGDQHGERVLPESRRRAQDPQPTSSSLSDHLFLQSVPERGSHRSCSFLRRPCGVPPCCKD